MSFWLLRTFPGAVTSLPWQLNSSPRPRKPYTLHFSTSTPVTRSKPLSPSLRVPLASSRPLHQPLGILPTWYVAVVVQPLSHVRFCNPMDCSIPGLPLSLSLGVCSNSCPLSRRYHLSISSSVIPFSSCSQSFPASMSFQMRQFFTSGGQSTGASNSASVLQMNTQDWSPLGWTGWISLQSKGLSKVFSNSSKASILWHSAFIKVQLSHLYMTTGKTIALTIWTFVSKVVSLLFNLLSRFIIACCSSHKSAEVSAMMSLPWPPICSSHPSYMMLFKPYINLLLFLLSISSPLQASH